MCLRGSSFLYPSGYNLNSDNYLIFLGESTLLLIMWVDLNLATFTFEHQKYTTLYGNITQK